MLMWLNEIDKWKHCGIYRFLAEVAERMFGFSIFNHSRCSEICRFNPVIVSNKKMISHRISICLFRVPENISLEDNEWLRCAPPFAVSYKKTETIISVYIFSSSRVFKYTVISLNDNQIRTNIRITVSEFTFYSEFGRNICLQSVWLSGQFNSTD